MCAAAAADHGVPCRPWPTRAAEQRVVAGVELDLVDAAAEAVVRVQLRRVAVGQPRVVLHRLRAGLGAQRGQAAGGGAGQQAGRHRRQRVAQRPVGSEQVDVDQRRALVADLVRGVRGSCGGLSICDVRDGVFDVDGADRRSRTRHRSRCRCACALMRMARPRPDRAAARHALGDQPPAEAAAAHSGAVTTRPIDGSSYLHARVDDAQ